MRWLAMGVAALGVWLIVATQVPYEARIGIGGVVVGAIVTQPFGCTNLVLEPYDPLCPWHHKHTGIDLAAPTGTEVHSATFGNAVTGFDPAGAGMFVAVIDDANVRVLYCHLSAFRVRYGDEITPGQVVGLVGASGLATGPHVHFEIDVDGVPVDPAAWLGS